MVDLSQSKRRLFCVSDGESGTCSRTRDLNGRYRKAGIGRSVTDRPAGVDHGQGAGILRVEQKCGSAMYFS
jgi:hypothetical protein